jgi:hypothetical protein
MKHATGCRKGLLRDPNKKSARSKETHLGVSLRKADRGATLMSLTALFIFVLLVICAADPCLSRAQCIPKEDSLRTEIFSAIDVIRGVGPAGSELRLEGQGDKVVATLWDYRGEPAPAETKLQGLLKESLSAGIKSSECKVQLRGFDKQGEVKIEGETTLARFRGVVTRYIGKEIFSYRISLKREMSVYDHYPGAL